MARQHLAETCGPDRVCVEALRACRSPCDGDGDGDLSIACGGGEWDDDDPGRSSLLRDVCDA